MALPTPKSFSLRQLPRLDTRWATVPTHRRLDARDVLLEEGLRLVDLRSPYDGYPFVENISKVAPDISSGAYAGVDIIGSNLLGGATKGSKTFGTGNAALTIENVIPGREVVNFVIQAGVGSLTISANMSTRTVAVSLASGGSTATAVRNAINSDSVAKYLVNASAGGTGGSNVAAVALTEIVGTSGAPVAAGHLYDAALFVGNSTISFSETSAVGILDWTDNAITFDMDASGLTAGSQYPVRVIVDGVQTLAGFMTAVA